MNIDFHVHMLDEHVFRASSNKTVFSGFGANPVDEPRPGARALLMRMMRPEALLEDMDARGIDMAVVTASSVLQGSSWADPKTDLELCRRCNATAAEWQAKYPKRFIASTVLPLQDVSLSLSELNGKTRVINAGSSYNGVYLGDPVYHPFWEAVNETGATVWIHPEGVRDPWFQRYALWNSAGQSIEEAKVMASLIYEGVMHRFPELKVVVAHGGGYFPHYMGRMDRNHANRPDTVKNTGGRKPSDFLRSFHYDSCVYDPAVIKVLLERVGADRIVMGSDYPVGEKDPVGWIRGLGLEKNQTDLICGANAARLLGLQ
ncbi:MAG TPA: amidohydrolase family protein [Burkholderiales bacterium]|nr:amidohydrolase family protein [Burkholderiales bacterium]